MITAQYVNRRVAALVREARAMAQLTQQQLADRADLNRATIANIELGLQAVTVQQLLSLAKALSVEPPRLIPVLPDDATDTDDAMIAEAAQLVLAAV